MKASGWVATRYARLIQSGSHKQLQLSILPQLKLLQLGAQAESVPVAASCQGQAAQAVHLSATLSMGLL